MLQPSLYGHDTPARRATDRDAPNAAGSCDLTLARALRMAGGAGDFTATDALDAVAAFVRRAHHAGLATAHVTSVIRRSFASAAPGTMTIVAYDALARSLVRHALYVLHTLESRGA